MMITEEDLWEQFIEAVDQLSREDFLELFNRFPGINYTVDDVRWEQDDV